MHYLFKKRGLSVLSQNSDSHKMNKTEFYGLKKILSQVGFI